MFVVFVVVVAAAVSRFRYNIEISSQALGMRLSRVEMLGEAS